MAIRLVVSIRLDGMACDTYQEISANRFVVNYMVVLDVHHEIVLKPTGSNHDFGMFDNQIQEILDDTEVDLRINIRDE